MKEQIPFNFEERSDEEIDREYREKIGQAPMGLTKLEKATALKNPEEERARLLMQNRQEDNDEMRRNYRR